MANRMFNPAADRNKGPILEVLKKFLPSNETQHPTGLEISSGSGQHVAFLASHFKNIIWQPSEYDKSQLPSIQAYIVDAKLDNVLPPVCVDITAPLNQWELDLPSNEYYDFMLNINMIHISPWACTEALFARAAELLKPGGLLFTYGPYALDGLVSPESNVRFHESLQARDPHWGLRDVADLKAFALKNRITLVEMIATVSLLTPICWRQVRNFIMDGLLLEIHCSSNVARNLAFKSESKIGLYFENWVT